MPAIDPLSPPSYIAGTITISGGNISTSVNLLSLIQSQLGNCPGSAMNVNISIGGTGDVAVLYVGVANSIGALSSSNYGYVLSAATGYSVRYTGSYPGATAPVGALFVLGAAGTFHVEVQA